MNKPRYMFLLLLLLVSCKPPEDRALSQATADVQVDFQVVGEATMGEAELEINLSQEGQPLERADIDIVGDMTHAGMIPVLSDTREVEPGRYLTDSFAFTMAGDWIITAEIMLADGQSFKRELSLTVPAQ